METKDYFKFQELVRKEAEQVATEVYNKLGTKYGVGDVPTHTHNGVDSVRISETDIVKGNKNLSGYIVDSEGAATGSSTTTVYGFNTANINRIVFYGFAANNADGTPATKRGVIQGEAQFGRAYSFSGPTGSTVVTFTNTPGEQVVQISNYMYVDNTDLTKNRVGITVALAAVRDDTGATGASLTIDSYDHNSITFTGEWGTNWKLQGNIIIS